MKLYKKNIKTRKVVPMIGELPNTPCVLLFQTKTEMYYIESQWKCSFSKYNYVLVKKEDNSKLERFKNIIIWENLNKKDFNDIILCFIATLEPLIQISMKTKESELLKIIRREQLCLEYIKTKNNVLVYDPKKMLTENIVSRFFYRLLERKKIIVESTI